MILNNPDSKKVQQIIKEIYSDDLTDNFLESISPDICKMLDSQYFATFFFPNSYNPNPIMVSNNPSEFNNLYLPIISSDFMMNSLIDNPKPKFYKSFVSKNIPGKKDFLGTLQKVRPVSDVMYIPIKHNGVLTGFTAIAKAGTKERYYTNNEYEIFQFLTNFINEGFSRRLLTYLNKNKALINFKGEVIDIDNELLSIFSKLFGLKNSKTPCKGLNKNSIDFYNYLQCFLSPLKTKKLGVLRLGNENNPYTFKFKFINNPNYRSYYPEQPQIEISLITNGINMNKNIYQLDLLKNEFSFTNREDEVIHKILLGYSNNEISQFLKISPATVKRHIWNIFNKAGVDSRSMLVFKLTSSFTNV